MGQGTAVGPGIGLEVPGPFGARMKCHAGRRDFVEIDGLFGNLAVQLRVARGSGQLSALRLVPCLILPNATNPSNWSARIPEPQGLGNCSITGQATDSAVHPLTVDRDGRNAVCRHAPISITEQVADEPPRRQRKRSSNNHLANGPNGTSATDGETLRTWRTA